MIEREKCSYLLAQRKVSISLLALVLPFLRLRLELGDSGFLLLLFFVVGSFFSD